MSYAGYGQPQYRPEPKIRFDAIGEAWGMVRAKMGVWVLIMLVYVLVYSVFSGILFGISYGLGIRPPSQGNGFTAGYVIFEIVGNIVSLAVAGFLQAGLYRTALKQVRGQEIEVSDLFSAGEVVGQTIVAQIVYGIATYIGMLLCIIPGFIVAGRGMFTLPLAADKGRSGLDAFRESWDALKNDTLNALGFMFVAGLASGIGFLACGIGGLFTAPIAPLAVAILYHEFFDTEGGGGPTLNMPLPPQSAYAPGQYNPGMMPPPPGSMPPPPGRSLDVPPAPGQTPPGQKPPDNPGEMGSIQM